MAGSLIETDCHMIRLSNLTLDLARGRLFCPSGDVAIRAKSFALLGHLADAGPTEARAWPRVSPAPRQGRPSRPRFPARYRPHRRANVTIVWTDEMFVAQSDIVG